MTKNTFLKSLFVLLISASIIWLVTWRNHDGNRIVGVHDCIYNVTHETAMLSSMGKILNVNYVQNADKKCISQYFPAIHISTPAKHNAWLHIVRTDAAGSPQYIQFIDAVEELYPLYTLDQDFYDGPLWQYGLFSKPLTFWKGHVYAVNIDRKNKTIKCVGGIEWGFKLSYFRLRPQMITPSPLTIQDWERDWSVFKVGFKEDIKLIK